MLIVLNNSLKTLWQYMKILHWPTRIIIIICDFLSLNNGVINIYIYNNTHVYVCC